MAPCETGPLCEHFFSQVDTIDRRVGALEQDAVERRTLNDGWSQRLDKLSDQVDGIQASVNRAAGALWLLGGLGGVSFVAWFARWLVPALLSH